jgi:DNA-binding CsgD family transcriptional regulator
MTRTEQLSDFLNELYQLPLNPDAWPGALQGLLGWVGGCGAVLLHRQRSAAPGAACLRARYCAGVILDWAALAEARSEPLASCAQRAAGLAAGAALALSDLPGATGGDSPGAAHGDLLIAVIDRDSAGHSTELLIAREVGQGRWDRAARAPLTLLMPHLQRVLCLSAALSGADEGGRGLMQRAQSAARRYEFTPAEARVFEALLGGRTVGSVARTLGVGEATVKTHLQHIFDKTDTRRQIDLVRLLSDPQHAAPRLVPSRD